MTFIKNYSTCAKPMTVRLPRVIASQSTRERPAKPVWQAFKGLIPLLVTGCASMAPPYQAPALPVPADYASSTAQQGTSVEAIGWRDYFTDPQLQALIEQALNNNRDLRTAVLRVEEARAIHGIQRSEMFPAIGAQASVDRSRTPADLSFTGKPILASQYQAGLGMSSWEIDFWGRVRSLQDAALEKFLATDAARRAASIGLVAQVANAYLVLREVDERIALAHQTIASREESFRIVTRRVEVGATARLNLTEVQTLLTQAQTLGVQLELARATQLNALILLIGAPVDIPPQRGQLDERNTFSELRPGLPSDLLVQRPDIVAGRRVLDHGCGSGLVAIAAARAGATVLATDIDPLARAATGLNAIANDVFVTVIAPGDPMPLPDLVLAGDVFYDQKAARESLAALERYHAAGAKVLIGDPGRRDLPLHRLLPVATYDVPEFAASAGSEIPAVVYALQP